MKTDAADNSGVPFQQTCRYAPYMARDTGLLGGTTLLTLQGEIPVDCVSIGDKVITRDSGIARVTHLQRSTRMVHTIAVAAGSLGHTRPECDAMLAGDQMCLIRDWRAQAMFGADRALVAARTLVDGEFIRDLGLREQTLFQIFCEGPHILYAQGLEVSTADGARARGQVLHAA